MGTRREWRLLPGLVHNYEVNSPRAIAIAEAWASGIWGFAEAAPATAAAAGWRIAAWLAAVVGMIGGLGGLYGVVKGIIPEPYQDFGMQVVNLKRYLWGKALLWMAALPVAVILMGLYLFIPLHNPTFNLIYGGFIGGYGILMFNLYRMGRTPGTAGKLKLAGGGEKAGVFRWGLAIGFNVGLFALLTVFYQTGQGQVPPVGERLAWVIIFTPLTALGFWVGLAENSTLARQFPAQPGAVRWAIGIGLLPFFLRVGLLAALNSISGMVGAVLGLLALAVVILQAEITRLLTGSLLAAVILESLLLYWIVLPAGPLFVRPF